MKKYGLPLLALFFLTSGVLAKELPLPEKEEMTLSEILLNIFDLEGKVVEAEITHVMSFSQTESGKYRALCHHHQGRSAVASETVHFPREGKELLEELIKQTTRSGPTRVYLHVVRKGRIEALGTRYRKSKNQYIW